MRHRDELVGVVALNGQQRCCCCEVLCQAHVHFMRLRHHCVFPFLPPTH